MSLALVDGFASYLGQILTTAVPEAATAEEPYVTVVPEVDCFDVGLRAEIAEDHSSLVDRMIAELSDRDGVDSGHRYGPAALVVDAASWEVLRLQRWLTLWLQRHLPADS